MYLRFVTGVIDEDSRRPQGVFTAAYTLLHSGELRPDEWAHLRQVLDWFNENLPQPPKKFAASRVLFWFRAEAKASIGRVWEIVSLLREHGHQIEIHKCQHLNNRIYEDEFQVAAYPSDGDSRVVVN